MRYISKHAYIEVVLRNYNYCSAASKFFEILISNFSNFVALSGLVELFLILGTIIVSLLVTVMSHLLLKSYGNWRNIEFETIGPILIVLVISVAITSLFNNVFEISVDTMLHCYVLDQQYGNGYVGNSP